MDMDGRDEGSFRSHLTTELAGEGCSKAHQDHNSVPVFAGGGTRTAFLICRGCGKVTSRDGKAL